MKSKLFQTLMFLCAIMLFASCKKETIEPVPAEAQVLNEPAAVAEGAYALTATKKLQKIMWNGSATTPFATFAYDTKGRLTKAINQDGDVITYTYKDSTVLIKRKVAGIAKAKDSLAGKLNSKGYLTSLKGYTSLYNYSTGKDDVITRTYSYAYNSAGQLLKITASAKTGTTTSYFKTDNTWNNGNLAYSLTEFDAKTFMTMYYTYDGAKADKRGVWNTFLLPYWTDNLIGLRPKHLVTVTTQSHTSSTPTTNKETWTLNAEGYPTSSILKQDYTGYQVKFTYTFQ
jgi:hypothetical protein